MSVNKFERKIKCPSCHADIGEEIGSKFQCIYCNTELTSNIEEVSFFLIIFGIITFPIILVAIFYFIDITKGYAFIKVLIGLSYLLLLYLFKNFLIKIKIN